MIIKVAVVYGELELSYFDSGIPLYFGERVSICKAVCSSVQSLFDGSFAVLRDFEG